MKSFYHFLSESKLSKTHDILEYCSLCESDELLIDVINERAKSTATSQPYKRLTSNYSNLPENERMSVYDDIVNSYAKPAARELESLLKQAGQKNAKVIVNIKPFKSFDDKILNRKKKPEDLHDVLRSAVLLSDQKDLERTMQFLLKKAKIFEHEKKEKKKSGDYGYYGSHHLKIEMRNKLIAEVQVMLKSLWVYKKEAHTIYKKHRSGSSVSDQEKRADLARSRQIFYKGNRVKKRTSSKRTQR